MKASKVKTRAPERNRTESSQRSHTQRAAEARGSSAREPSHDSPDALSAYMSGLQAYDMLDAKQEIALAERIEELEIAHWACLLGHAPALEPIGQSVAAHMKAPKELAALRKLTRVPTRERSRAAHKAATETAARALRARDVTRTALHDADRKVRETFAEQPACARYLARCAEARAAQQAVKNRFMTANLRLVVSLARRYETKLMPLTDLIQEGNLGLMRAVERFDHKRGFRFSTYAAWWIRHGLNRALSDKGRLVRLPVHLIDDAQRAHRSAEEFLRENGRAATPKELAERTGMSEQKVAFVQLHGAARPPTSFDKPLGDDGDTSLMDVTPDTSLAPAEDALDLARWTDGLDALLATLSPIEVAILRMRFGLDGNDELTLQEIGAKYNLSRERIRQLQEQALNKLRAELARVREEREQRGERERAA